MSREGRGGSVLGVLAYLLVPGDRRRRASTHFRRAGIEAAIGVGELVRPGRTEGKGGGATERQRIEIL